MCNLGWKHRSQSSQGKCERREFLPLAGASLHNLLKNPFTTKTPACDLISHLDPPHTGLALSICKHQTSYSGFRFGRLEPSANLPEMPGRPCRHRRGVGNSFQSADDTSRCILTNSVIAQCVRVENQVSEFYMSPGTRIATNLEGLYTTSPTSCLQILRLTCATMINYSEK